MKELRYAQKPLKRTGFDLTFNKFFYPLAKMQTQK